VQTGTQADGNKEEHNKSPWKWN